ncbi:MAG: extensin family protein [Pseudomonadota bacterium]
MPQISDVVAEMWRGIALSLLLSAPGWASAPDRSERPSPRGVLISPVQAVPVEVPRAILVEAAGVTKGLTRSLRPKKRPKVRFVTRKIVQSAKGSVCGDPAIKGVVIAPIRGRGACGVANPVRVSSVAGVSLSQKPTINCTTARALKSWVADGLKPAVGRVGGGVKSLRIVAHYACRNRNSAKTGKLSEHAKGKAVDISAITMNNGQMITVLDGWRGGQQRRILRAAHRAACGPFGTVLGPDSNKFHRDHFHFDTASYRSGPYCR